MCRSLAEHKGRFKQVQPGAVGLWRLYQLRASRELCSPRVSHWQHTLVALLPQAELGRVALPSLLILYSPGLQRKYMESVGRIQFVKKDLKAEVLPGDLQAYPGAQRGSTGSGAKPRSVIFPK